MEIRCFDCGDFIRDLGDDLIIANSNSEKLHNYHKECYRRLKNGKK